MAVEGALLDTVEVWAGLALGRLGWSLVLGDGLDVGLVGLVM